MTGGGGAGPPGRRAWQIPARNAARVGEVSQIQIAPRREPGAWWPADHTAQDVAMLRRRLIEYHGSSFGLTIQEMMCRSGRQVLTPAGRSVAEQARIVCGNEVARLRAARLFYAAPETVELIGAAYDGFPSVPAQVSDPPSECGFIVFGAPLLSRPVTPEERAEYRRMLTGSLREDSLAAPIYITAAAWGPFVPDSWARAPGIWVSFYAALSPVGEAARPRNAGTPPLSPENETAWACLPARLPPGKSEGDYALPDDRTGTAGWGRLLTCVWHLMRQQHLLQADAERVARPERRRHERAGLADPGDVVVVSYRRAVRAEAETAAAALAGAARPAGEWYRVRFPVSPHWRRQWYPSRGEHRPKYIPAHWKGPADAPVQIRDRVNVF